jgi:methionyl-tRNA formyltransferase
MAATDVSPRIALAGSVSFSRVTLEGLLRNRANVVGALGLSASKSANVSDYARMDDIAKQAGIPYADFENINEAGVLEAVRTWKPDLLFVVGLSQLAREQLLAAPSRGCIGFHPTHLPCGRGRAPVAWLTHDGIPGAATFFLMDEGTDSGAILVQEPFPVAKDARSSDVIDEVRAAIGRALDRWIPRLVKGEWNPAPQDHSKATYLGKRGAEDGLIDWSQSALEIDRLVRTAGRPYPGAYTYVKDAKLLIWRTEVDRSNLHRGVTGRVLEIDGDGAMLVQTGHGRLWLRETEFQANGERPRVAVGTRLGYAAENEIYVLRRRVAELERRIAELAERLDQIKR